jgi:chemotaxis response regulator CheB
MPREAIRLGSVDETLALDRIAARLLALAAGERRATPTPQAAALSVR